MQIKIQSFSFFLLFFILHLNFLHLHILLILNILLVWIKDFSLVLDVAAGDCETATSAALLHEEEHHGQDDGQDKEDKYGQ